MYYMSINTGSFTSPCWQPHGLAAKFGWSVAFALSFVGMLITVVNFLFCRVAGLRTTVQNLISNRCIWANCWPPSWRYYLAAIATWLLHNQGVHAVLGVVVLVSSSSSRKKPSRCRVRPSQDDCGFHSDAGSDYLLRALARCQPR